MISIDLSGRTALVSGSTAGIGLAIAKRLAEAGARVIVNGRGDARTEQALATIRKDVPNADLVGFAGDLGTEAGASAIIAAHPDVDILVNSLGIFEAKPFADIDDASWTRFFETNVMSGVRLSRHYLPRMVARDWGRVMFVSSESGLNIPADMIHYGFTKAAQIAIARGLAESVAGSRVTVNSVLPGPTRTEGVLEMFRQAAKKTGKSEDEIERSFIPENRPSSIIKRLAEPEEIANMVVYLASDLASVTTGAAVRVEGGLLRHPG